MNLYEEITVVTTHDGSELVADILSTYAEDGVFIDDCEDVRYLYKLGKTWDYLEDGVEKTDPAVTVKCYVKVSEKERVLSKIKEDFNRLKKDCPFDLGSLSITVSEVDGDIWQEKWKENFKPIKLGKITVVPLWLSYEADENEIPVLIGSNMAFGTGEHETTALCIEKIQKYITSEDVVLDVGTGSGILGIAAKKLGAKRVIMTDIDECAVEAANENVKINGVKDVEVYLKNLLDDNTVKGDLLVANIMAEVLISFASGITNNLKGGATVILSGILTDRKDKVVKAYETYGFELLETEDRGEWSVVVLKKGK